MSVDDARAALEPTVAAIERARHVAGRCQDLTPTQAASLAEALDSAQARVVRLWFGDDSGQDTLFAEHP